MRMPAAWHLMIFVMSVLTLALLALSVTLKLPSEIVTLLVWADTLACVFFLVDFVWLLVLSPNKWRYFFTWGWLDLISAIPLFHYSRWATGARVVRLIRLVRGWKSAEVLVHALTGRARQTTGFAVGSLTVVWMLFSSTAILIAETGSGGPISTPGEALWWTVVTMTTTGYGDLVPVTDLGKVVAGFTMLMGLLLIGTFTALVASSLVANDTKERQQELQSLRLELDEIREFVRRANSERSELNSEDGNSPPKSEP